MHKYFWIAVVFWSLCVGVALLRWDPHLQVQVLDIGQGDAILVTTLEQNHILVDGGPDSAVLSQLGEALPFFFRDIDLMVLTHPHTDHLVGLISVLQRFEVKAVLLSAPAYQTEEFDAFLRAVEEEGAPVYMADDEVDFRFGSTVVDVLYPFEPTTGDVFSDVNQASVVLKVSDEEGSVLMMGDATVAEEAALLARGVDVRAEVLKVGHHGSRGSSSLAFLEAVAPRLLVISCGLGNGYGHPHRETLDKAAALGVPVLRTDVEGRISLEMDELDSVLSALDLSSK